MDEAFLEKQRPQQPLGINAEIDVKELIQSIVISPTAKPFFEELVQIISERHGLNHLVRKSALLNTPAF